MAFPPIRACIFDNDGLLIDSEEIYAKITDSILNAHGRPSLPWSIKSQLQGRPAPQVNHPFPFPSILHVRKLTSILRQAKKIIHAWAQLPISEEEYDALVAAQQAVLFPTARPLRGVESLLTELGAREGVEICLATSASREMFTLKTAHLQPLFAPAFGEAGERIVLGDEPGLTGRGKPAPWIYLAALDRINTQLRLKHANAHTDIRPEECLVFEDSVPGVEAGRRAGMRVVWIPHPELARLYEGRVEKVLAGLEGEYAEEHTECPDGGRTGKLGDGWGEVLRSIDELDLGKYGVRVAGRG
ncbi:MAG: hypothetical protein M1813_009758 [Trichoglossum hirsutum]|nr:MAG: hypothetical protein M1813_009758 [Trichoglossum hirsutum]